MLRHNIMSSNDIDSGGELWLTGSVHAYQKGGYLGYWMDCVQGKDAKGLDKLNQDHFNHSRIKSA